MGEDDAGCSLHREPANLGGLVSEGGDAVETPGPPGSPRKEERTGGVACFRSTRDVESGGPRAGLGSQNLVWGAGFWKAAGGGGDREAPPTSPGQPERGGGNFRSALEEARGGGGGCGSLSPSRGEGEVDPPRSLPLAGTDAFRILRLRESEGKTGLGRGRHVGGRTGSARRGEGTARRSPGRAAERGVHRTRHPGIPRLDAGTTEFPAAEAGATPVGVAERSLGTPRERDVPVPREPAAGRRAVWGTRAARAGEEEGHPPLPPSRPHCLSRLRPGPAP